MTRSRLASVRARLLEGAILLWSIVTLPLAVYLAFVVGRPWALLALIGAPLAFAMRAHPLRSAAAIVFAAMVLRIGFLGLTSSDPIVVSQLAFREAIAGGDPYAARYLDGLPYPYGPAGLLTYLAGVPAEVVATVATSFLLARAGAWMTLAVFNSWPQFLYMPVIGNNDFSVGFVALAALLLLRSNRVLGMVMLALATAIKPYVAAWIIPAALYGGVAPFMWFIITSIALWSPVLFVWGVPSFYKAVTEAELLRTSLSEVPSWSFGDYPVLRWTAVPLGVLAILLRSWRSIVLIGAVVFVVFLGFAPRAPQPYIAFLLPIVGYALEMEPRPVPAQRRRLDRQPGTSMPAAPVSDET